MRKLNKIILAGLVTILVSCSSEQSTTGATTEPSSTPVSALTDEQKALLARSLVALMDPSVADSLEGILDSVNKSLASDVNAFYNQYLHPLPWSVKNDQVFHHPSKDKRKVCDVVTFSQVNEMDRKGVVRAMSYDDDHECAHNFDPYSKCSSDSAVQDYFYNHPNETIYTTKIAYVDGIPVVLNTIGSRKMMNSFWGYGVSCSEALEQFKDSCDHSNGLFWDLGDGCSRDDLEVVCASFVPEGKTADEMLDYYLELNQSLCRDDSVKYAPYDDENYVRIDPYTYQPYLDSLNRIAYAERDWGNTVKHSTYAYRWQFSIIDSTVKIDQSGKVYYTERKDDELFGWAIAYNTLPETPVADAYRKEGVYVLPDSLVTTFFPTLAEYPGRLDEFRAIRSSKNSIYYLVVLKDVGTKGHIMDRVTENGFIVTEIVKSGNCPEDTTVHYPIILLADSPEWNALNRPIVKKTYVSDKWNCDKPESLAKIEPYGEWIITNVYDYGEYVKLFGAD